MLHVALMRFAKSAGFNTWTFYALSSSYFSVDHQNWDERVLRNYRLLVSGNFIELSKSRKAEEALRITSE
jgi:hypothetical protein